MKTFVANFEWEKTFAIKFLGFYPIGSNSSIPYQSTEYYYRFIEAQKFAYAQRQYLGDPKFVKNFNVENLLKKEFVDEIYAKILNGNYSLSSANSYIKNMDIGGINDNGTSQITIVDSDGNAVSLTSSINNMLVFFNFQIP